MTQFTTCATSTNVSLTQGKGLAEVWRVRSDPSSDRWTAGGTGASVVVRVSGSAFLQLQTQQHSEFDGPFCVRVPAHAWSFAKQRGMIRVRPTTVRTLRPAASAAPRTISADRLWADVARTRLTQLSAVAQSQGKQPPSSEALVLADQLVVAFEARDVAPDRIAAEADGGVAFYFFRPSVRGRIVVDNDGCGVASVSRAGLSSMVLEFSPSQSASVDDAIGRVLRAISE